MQPAILKKLQAFGKTSLANIALVTNAFVWYFFAISLLKDIVSAVNIDPSLALIIWGIHFAGICFAAIAGAVISSKKQNRKNFLLLWMSLGVVASFFSLIIDKGSIANILFLSAFLGVSLGIGMPSCMGYFTESIQVQNRGKVGGLILFISGITMFGLSMIANGSILNETIILTAWRAAGLLLLLPIQYFQKEPSKMQQTSYASLVSQKPFILYLVPWLMFSLITFLTIPIATDLIGKPNVDFLITIENVLVGIFSLVGGFLIDAVGRKRIAIVGFAVLGLGYSVLGIYPKELLSWYLYIVVDGIAWGMLYVLFVVTLWGDLSHERTSDKYYALGVLPFFISKFLQLTLGDIIASSIGEAVFSFVALFLFIAVLPLIYAPETLPEKVLKDRDLKNYVEKAQKKRAKEAGEKQKKVDETGGNKKESEEETEADREYEARRLAEKYY
jgi:MFS family permease